MTHGITLDLWLAAEPLQLAPPLVASWTGLLSRAERERWQRFARAEDRDRFLLVRALVRKVLGRELDVPPEELVFRADAHGKPRVVLPPATTLHFNLSHTRGLCVLALCRHVEVGVDVEAFARKVDLMALARRYFATPEVLALDALAPEPQRELFFALWTLKEAWVKAKGLGLRVPLDAFSFAGPGLQRVGAAATDGERSEIGAPGPAGIALHCEPSLREDPAQWSFRLLRHGGFRMAVAAAHPATRPLSLVLHDAGSLLRL